MDKVRYGIVGIGSMGSVHAFRLQKGLIKNATLTAVCDIDEGKRKKTAEKWANVKVFDNHIALLDSGLVDAVVIATPHYDHPIIAMDALNRGIHTLIEKPAGVYTSKVREMNELAKQKPDLAFGIMYNQRTNPLYQYAKKVIESGEMGELKRISWIITNWYRPQAYYDQGGWRGTWAGEGGGVLINQCPHQIDLFQWLGGMPKTVRGYTKVGRGREINVENDVTAYFEYENGASGVFITSTHDFPGTNRLEIDCDKGQIVIDKNKLRHTILEVGETEFNKTNKKTMPSIPKKVIKKKNTLLQQAKQATVGQHAAILKNFTEHILFGKPLLAPGEDGIRGLTISNAIHLSGWLQQEVAIPFDESLYEVELEKRKAEEKASAKKKV